MPPFGSRSPPPPAGRCWAAEPNKCPIKSLRASRGTRRHRQHSDAPVAAMAALGFWAPPLAGLPGSQPAHRSTVPHTPSCATRSQAARAAPAAAPARRRRCGAAARRQHAAAAASRTAAGGAQDIDADVCVLGAGIIGLCTALALLRAEPQLRVALVDRQVPCSGATGAGKAQGGSPRLASRGSRAAMPGWCAVGAQRHFRLPALVPLIMSSHPSQPCTPAPFCCPTVTGRPGLLVAGPP